MTDWTGVLKEFNGRWDMCFGCGQKNPIGMKLVFKKVGNAAHAEFIPREEFEGWPGVLHGGLIANILDEAASWAFNYAGMLVVTARMEVLYRSPAKTGAKLIITSEVVARNGKRGEAVSRIVTEDGTLIAEAKSLHVAIKIVTAGNHEFAVIWDMDGVIVDTARFHLKSWQAVFKKHGVEFTGADFTGLFGQRNDRIIRTVLDREVPPAEIDEIAHDKEEFFRNNVRGNITALPGVIDLIKALNQQGIKMAIASSAPMENIQLLLGSLGIIDCFQQLVPGKEVSESKPSPQLFLLAAKKLGATPDHCIVFEDAIAGVTAAKRAGMHCVAVTTTNAREKLSEADMVVDTLESVNTGVLEQMVAHD
jgi:beta-phosphoglucomutase family hydrolase